MISTRCYPRRIFERSAKLFAPAFVLQQLGFTRFASNAAAKLTPRYDSLEMAR